MPTIRDIAEKTGYSIAAVSRVLNHDPTLSVSDGAREKIIKTAEQMNYKTKSQRKPAKENTNSYSIGMVFLDSEHDQLHDPYFLAIRMGVEKTCAERSINLVKHYRNDSRSHFKDLQYVDGVLVVGRLPPEEIDELTLFNPNITFIDHSPLDAMFDSVVIDFRSAMITVLDHLINLGHTRIGMISGRQYIRPGQTTTDSREIVFRDYLHSTIGYSEEDIYIGNFTAEEGYRLMKEAINNNFTCTAFFAASDSMAIGAMRALHEHSYHIPNDVSIIGFNDIAASRYLQPSLTTVNVYTEFMGQTAVEIMFERLTSKREIPRKTIIPTQLIIRESTSKAK